MRQRAVAQLQPERGPPSTDAQEEAAEVLAELKEAQAREGCLPPTATCPACLLPCHTSHWVPMRCTQAGLGNGKKSVPQGSK